MFTSTSNGCASGSSQTACLCSSTSFQQSATSCILENCPSSSDQQSAYGAAEQVCSQAGVTLPSWAQLEAQVSASSTSAAASTSSTSATFTSSVGDTRVPSVVALMVFMFAGFMLV